LAMRRGGGAFLNSTSVSTGRVLSATSRASSRMRAGELLTLTGEACLVWNRVDL
jgi:hypothetical protein